MIVHLWYVIMYNKGLLDLPVQHKDIGPIYIIMCFYFIYTCCLLLQQNKNEEDLPYLVSFFVFFTGQTVNNNECICAKLGCFDAFGFYML